MMKTPGIAYLWAAAAFLGVVLGAHAAHSSVDPAIEARREFLDAARLTPDRNRGAQRFAACTACHGQDGLGASDGSVPAIAGQHGSVLLKQLVDFRNEQRWNFRMQQTVDWHRLPTAQDLTDVAAFVASLPRFPTNARPADDGALLHEGARVYFRLCDACHGPLGQGDGLRLRPRLAGQHYDYLLRQLTDTAAGYRPGMDRMHVERIRGLTPEQMRGVADYLSRVSPDLSSESARPR